MKCLVHVPGWCVSVVAAHDKVVRSYSLESGCWSHSFLLRSVDPELGLADWFQVLRAHVADLVNDLILLLEQQLVELCLKAMFELS